MKPLSYHPDGEVIAELDGDLVLVNLEHDTEEVIDENKAQNMMTRDPEWLSPDRISAKHRKIFNRIVARESAPPPP